MTALEARLRMLANNSFEQSRQRLQLVGGGVESYANRRQYSLFRQAAEIAHTALQDVCIGQNDLLAAFTAQPCRLDADVFDLADEGVYGQAVADHKRLVQGDRQRGKQIAENILQSQRNRNAADSEAREQRGDVDAEIIERDQNQQRPDQHAR